jgi:hypothetical protein
VPRRRSGIDAGLPAAAGVGLAGWLFVGGTLGPVAGAVAAACAWRVLDRVEPSAARREREEVERTLPHLIDLFASVLRAGA